MKLTRFISIFWVCLLISAISISCSSSRIEMLGDIKDETERPLNTDITTVKTALPFAVARAKEWQPDAFLSGIGVSFEGKDEIVSKRGIIDAWFLVYNKANQPIGYAYILISMKNNNIFSFNAGPPIPKLETGLELNPNVWNIDIDRALDIAIQAIGKGELDKYENPKIVIECVQSFWIVTLYSGTKKDDGISYEHIIEVNIDPQTGQIISVRNIKQRLEELKMSKLTELRKG